MKQFLSVLAIIAAVAAAAVVILQHLPAPVSIREDFTCGD